MHSDISFISQAASDSAAQSACGALKYNMTNDYMFRAVLQENNKVLFGLICSLLHLKESDVHSVTITNPIILGKNITSKEFRLDINVILNDNTLINLEMQVTNKLNWPDRSLSYLCRSFDQLRRGQDYNGAGAVIHIGFIDYTLFEDCPEFYATYKLMNVKNHHVYSDSFLLSVVDLTQIAHATEEDKAYQIDYWAALFKATTWEEIKMLAAENEYINEASKTIFRLSADEQIQKRCRDREEYYQDLRAYDNTIAQQKSALQKINTELERKSSELEKKTTELDQKRAELDKKTTELDMKSAELDKKTTELDMKSAELNQKKTELNMKTTELDLKSAELVQKSAAYDELLAWAKSHGFEGENH